MAIKHYQHILFDLDRTLWDFETNVKEAFQDIRKKYGLEPLVDNETFVNTYRKHNERLWSDFRQGKIAKDRLRTDRFLLTLKDLGIHDEDLAERIGQDYLDIAPRKTKLLSGTKELLDYLSPQYNLHILTNGFRYPQQQKLARAHLENYFYNLITSESMNAQKPALAFFEYALKRIGVSPKHALMVGDDLKVDILGARQAGIDQVYLNPNHSPHNEVVTYEIHSLYQLIEIL